MFNMKKYFEKHRLKKYERKLNNEISSSDTIYKINSIKNIYSLTSLEDRNSFKSSESTKNKYINDRLLKNQKMDKSTQCNLVIFKNQDESSFNIISSDERKNLKQQINFKTVIPKIKLSFVDETESITNDDENEREERAEESII